MRRVKMAFGGVLVVGVAILGVTLSRSPISVARTNSNAHVLLGSTRESARICQSSEVLPRDTSAIRMQMFASAGPRVTVEVLAHGHIIAHGERGSGWTGGSVTVPVSHLATASAGVTLCFTLFLNGAEGVSLTGEPTNEALAAQERIGPLPGRIRVEYLRPDRSSWWSLILPVARRMGLGHAGSGRWSVLLVIGLMIGVLLLSSRVVLRELR
jgi:hypothetical protein